MIIQVTEHNFIDAFTNLRPDNFCYASLKALFEYYEECEEGSGVPVELDVIAICCDWTEYTYSEAVSAYGIDFKDDYFVLEVEEDLYLITG